MILSRAQRALAKIDPLSRAARLGKIDPLDSRAARARADLGKTDHLARAARLFIAEKSIIFRASARLGSKGSPAGRAASGQRRLRRRFAPLRGA